jgi:anaerobic magnesium-protoporphyrin IX monomethyl ester cyclase
MEPYAPLGSLYAAAVLRSGGLDVAFHDSMLSVSEAEWEAALDRTRPGYAVLFDDHFSYLSKMCLLRMREAAFRMIGSARRRGCVVIVGSSDASDHPEIYLSAGAHFVLLGEGEETLRELIRCLEAGAEDVSNVPGLAFRDEGRVVKTSPRGVIRKLDELPFPAWDLVDVERYRSIWLRRHGRFSMNMVTSRGCPFSCNWCAKPIWGQRYNARSPENVAEEMLRLKDRFGADHIWFMDDVMGIKPGWMERFANLVDHKGARLPFKCVSRLYLLLRDGEI